MQLHINAESAQLTVRHAPARIGAAGLLAAISGIGAPVLADQRAPWLVIPALGVTMLAALWIARLLGEVAVLDRHSIQLGAGRRSRRQLAWTVVAALTTHDGKIRATATTGAVITGPRCDDALWARVVDAASTLDLPLPDAKS
jgi:hypothetical protein